MSRSDKQGKRLGGITGKGFLPGQSGNPGGRPAGLAEKIRKATGDGHTILEFMFGVAEGERIDGRKPRLCDRIDANKWLADRGWGRPVQAMEHGGIGGGAIGANVVFYIPQNTRDGRSGQDDHTQAIERSCDPGGGSVQEPSPSGTEI